MRFLDIRVEPMRVEEMLHEGHEEIKESIVKAVLKLQKARRAQKNTKIVLATTPWHAWHLFLNPHTFFFCCCVSYESLSVSTPKQHRVIPLLHRCCHLTSNCGDVFLAEQMFPDAFGTKRARPPSVHAASFKDNVSYSNGENPEMKYDP